MLKFKEHHYYTHPEDYQPDFFVTKVLEQTGCYAVLMVKPFDSTSYLLGDEQLKVITPFVYDQWKDRAYGR
jgi:hypothetical protein